MLSMSCHVFPQVHKFVQIKFAMRLSMNGSKVTAALKLNEVAPYFSNVTSTMLWHLHMFSAESQKCIITIQQCSVENQNGTIAIDSVQ